MLTKSGNFDTKVLNDKYVVLLRKVLGSVNNKIHIRDHLLLYTKDIWEIKVILQLQLKWYKDLD